MVLCVGIYAYSEEKYINLLHELHIYNDEHRGAIIMHEHYDYMGVVGCEHNIYMIFHVHHISAAMMACEWHSHP